VTGVQTCALPISRVARIFAEVAGYELLVDPTTFRGPAVEKGETNGLHDGRIVQCPQPPRPGKCYQRLVDCSDGDRAFDLRTTIIGRRPQFVVVKSKPVADRFSIHNSGVELRPLEAVFTTAELELIERYARAIELDWGALDILRDRQSGRIYVVDVNKTDIGPAVDLSLRDRELLKAHISRAFRDMIAEHVSA